ncbi:hypothetical protein [Rhizobium sp. RU36D]|uniref:hypothetical protein n=1 Tax=Rhizobium sp. RU36D TaxID=1907415 RepID=UPI0009D8F95B|nr:hypothetical protein [Rhizobium sp. RU36D]SMD18642.1 hypothetical protein SAMN05880593_13557 [Rhizobium sp. RU36D]
MTENNAHTSATRSNVDASILRERISRAIFDPGETEGNRGQRTTTDWQTDAVMRVLGFAAPTPSSNVGPSE